VEVTERDRRQARARSERLRQAFKEMEAANRPIAPYARLIDTVIVEMTKAARK
jgi:hypothetical protein